MSELHLRQIRANIEKLFRAHIDLSDLVGKPDNEITNNFLTRGLAALLISP
jgi:hypothetical protein